MSSLLHGVSAVARSSWSRSTFFQLSSCTNWQEIFSCFNKAVLQPLQKVSWNLPEKALSLGQQLNVISFKDQICVIIEQTKKLAPSLFHFGLGLNKFLVESCLFLLVLVCSFFILHTLLSWIVFLLKSLITAWSSAIYYIFGRIFGDDDASRNSKPLQKVQHRIQLVSSQELNEK